MMYTLYIEYFITIIFICAVYGSKINIIYILSLSYLGYRWKRPLGTLRPNKSYCERLSSLLEPTTMCRPSFRTRELTVSEIRQAGKSLYSSSSLLLLLLLLLLFLDNHISRTTQATAIISGQIHSKFYQLRSFLLVDPRKSR